MYGCQQNLLHPEPDLLAILEFICSEANSLSNCGIYYARAIYFKTRRIIGKYDLEVEYKGNRHFQALHSQAAQQVLRSVAESFKSFKELTKLFSRKELTDKPKTPNYRKSGGMAAISYPTQALRLVDGKIRIPLGKMVKRWFGLDCFHIPMPSNLNFSDIRELRILPRNRQFYVEFVYQLETKIVELDSSRVLGIDHGIDNWLTCISNVGTSFIVDGKYIKSLNQWYNKQVAAFKENKPRGFWSNRLASITEKRNRQMRDAINKAARLVINHCLVNQIDNIVFGWNKRSKDSINIGTKNNQKFIQIPTAKLKDRIAQLCKQYGIRFEETEESYASQASFVDNDVLREFGGQSTLPANTRPTYGEKPREWKASGKRVKRGLYRTANNWYINADCNGA